MLQVTLAMSSAVAGAVKSSGSLQIFFEPLPPEAASLTFRFASIAVVDESDRRLPIGNNLEQTFGAGETRERRLAAATLDPGRYTGLVVKLVEPEGEDGAEEGEASEPIEIAAPFTVEKRRSVILRMRLDHAMTLERGHPVFQVVPSRRPPADLLGLASSRNADVVTLFDKNSGRVVGSIPSGRQPEGIAVASRQRRAYVALSGEDAIAAIDLLEYGELDWARLRGGDRPIDVTVTPGGETVLAVNEGSRTLSFIDALSLVETDRIEVGEEPRSVLLDAAGRRAFVFNYGSASITVVDVGTRRVTATVATEAGPLRGELDLAGERLYVIHESSPYLGVIDAASLVPAGRIFVGLGAKALEFDPRRELLYLGRRGSDTIEVYDPRSLLPVDSIPIDGEISFLSIDREGDRLWVALPELLEVQAFQLVGGKRLVRIDIGEEVFGLTITGVR